MKQNDARRTFGDLPLILPKRMRVTGISGVSNSQSPPRSRNAGAAFRWRGLPTAISPPVAHISEI